MVVKWDSGERKELRHLSPPIPFLPWPRDSFFTPFSHFMTAPQNLLKNPAFQISGEGRGCFGQSVWIRQYNNLLIPVSSLVTDEWRMWLIRKSGSSVNAMISQVTTKQFNITYGDQIHLLKHCSHKSNKFHYLHCVPSNPLALWGY